MPTESLQGCIHGVSGVWYGPLNRPGIYATGVKPKTNEQNRPDAIDLKKNINKNEKFICLYFIGLPIKHTFRLNFLHHRGNFAQNRESD